MLVLLRSSSEPFVRTLFTPTAAEQAQKGRKGSTRGVAHKFNAELEDLTVHLLLTLTRNLTRTLTSCTVKS